MMASMQDAMAGSDFHFTFGTAILGAIIHMMTGAMYVAVFGLTLGILATVARSKTALMPADAAATH